MDSNANNFQSPPCAKGDGTGTGTGVGQGGTWLMGSPVPPEAHPANQQAATWTAGDHARPPPPSYADCAASYAGQGYGPYGSGTASAPAHAPSSVLPGNPYVQAAPVAGSSEKGAKDTFFRVLGRCGKALEDSTKKAVEVSGNAWQHLKTSPNLTDAALAKLSQGTKVFAEGGHEKIFQQSFGVIPGEKLLKAFACYISTSQGPVIGTLYLSSARVAFCSDNPLCLNPSSGTGNQDWRYYKIIVQLDQLRAVTPSSHRTNPAEKYIQIVTMDNHEFWFMGFMSYDKALKNLTEALQRRVMASAPYYYQ